MDRFSSKEHAIAFIEKHFPVNGYNHISSDDVKRNKEFFILKQFIEAADPILTYPIAFRHCGTESGCPDFVLHTGDVHYLVEVSEITNRESQLIFKHQPGVHVGGVLERVDLTYEVKSLVDRKNGKLEKYRDSTKIEKSILVIYHNRWPPFLYGEPGDDLRAEEITSQFDHTFLFMPIFGVDKNYLKL